MDAWGLEQVVGLAILLIVGYFYIKSRRGGKK